MILWLRDLMDRYDQLSLRERVLVLLALVGVILLLWDSGLMGPLERERQIRQQQVEILRAEVAGLERSTEAIAAETAADPDASSRAAIEQLRQEIAGLDARLAGATSGLIEPQEMSRVLEQLLRQASRLRLNALRTLPPEPLLAAGEAAGPGAAPAAGSSAGGHIYRHGIELEVTGTYLETLRFLQALEALPWRFFWERIDFSVERHPQGRARLVLYTLGLEEGWIGV